MTLKEYFDKMKGTQKCPPRVGSSEVVWSWVGAFLGISAVAAINQFLLRGTNLTMVVGSFGASAVLIYGAIKSPLAQPRNLLGGHFLSAIVGVTCFKLLCGYPWLAGAMAVATAIAVMHLTKTLHPPGGATSLIAVIGDEKIHNIGYLYALMPALLGALVMLLVALIVNNIPSTRRYPECWFR
jgi:CBS-domain-containing membrane protein